MATVIGIFENQYNEPLTVVKPGTQTRRFTHISDTVDICYKAWKKVMQTLQYFTQERIPHSRGGKVVEAKIKFLPPRVGERYALP